MTDKIKRSQVALLILIALCVGKFMRLPGEMYNNIGRDFWLSIIIMFVLDAIGLACIIWVISRNNGKSLHDILEGSIGLIATKIVFAVFAAFFFMRTLTMSLNMMELLTNTLMIKTNWVAFFAPLLILIVVNLYKGFTTTARLGEILVVFVVLSVVGVYFFSSNRADYQNLKPFAEFGLKPIFVGATKYNFWFGDHLFVLFVLEKILPKSKEKKPLAIPLSFAAGAILSVCMITLFIALFGETSWLQNCAMSKVSQFSVRATASGRLDWLDLFIWLMGVALKVVIFSFCCVVALQNLISRKTNKQNPKIWAIAIFALVMFVLPLITAASDWIVDFNSSSPYRFVFWLVLYGVPFTLPFTFLLSRRRKQND